MNRPRLFVVGVLVLVVVVVAGAVGWIRMAKNVESGLVVQASTAAPGFAAASVLKGEGGGWRSQSQTVGSWIDLRWSSPRQLHSLAITPSRSGARITSGVLQFDDGSALQAVVPAGTTRISFGERQVRSVRFTVSAVSGEASYVGVRALRPNEGADDVVHDPTGDAVPGAALSGLQPSASTTNRTWTTSDPLNATWTFHWSAPRELVAIELAGASTGSTIKRATLSFPGGAAITIGAVSSNPALPTKVAFLPRTVQSLTLHIDEVAGSGDLTLSALRLWERGSRLATPPALQNGTTVDAPGSSCPSAGVSSTSSLQVECPVNGALVGERIDLSVELPAAATGVHAEVWPASGDAAIEPVVVSGTGVVKVPLDLSALPEGPVTVQLTAIGAGSLAAAPVQFQLLHGLGTPARTPTSRAARGKTLVWDDEFSDPVSVSRNDSEHRYAAGKPEPAGYSDFGDAIFADPSAGYGNIGTLAGRYLRLDVSPVLAGFTDPQGYNRKHIGAMLASAKPGGAGFSAQYGYFETRMLVPANPGTWPAFWLLPSSNLATPEQPVAEIDAAELYGHDPTGACHTTHSYSDGKDSGGVALCGQRFTSAEEASQWHTYGVSVEPTRIRYFIDGRQVASAAQVPGGERPMFFLLNLALGGGWPVELSGTEQRAQMLVDWVRAYV